MEGTGMLTRGAGPVRPVFVFSDLCSQSMVRIGAALLDLSPVVWDWMMRCDGALARYVDWSILDVVRQDIDTAEHDQRRVDSSVAFGLGVAMARLWLSAGVAPSRVLSTGTSAAAAAHTANQLSLGEAAQVALSDQPTCQTWTDSAVGDVTARDHGTDWSQVLAALRDDHVATPMLLDD